MTDKKLPQPGEQVEIESIAKALYKYRRDLNIDTNGPAAAETKQSLRDIIDRVNGPDKPTDTDQIKNKINQLHTKIILHLT